MPKHVSPSGLTTGQSRAKIDLRAAQGDRDGAILFCELGLFLKLRFVDPGNVGFGVQVDGRNPKGVADLFQLQACGGTNALWWEAGFFEKQRKRHRKAAGL